MTLRELIRDAVPDAVGGGPAQHGLGSDPAGPASWWTRISGRLAKPWYRLLRGELHMPYEYFQGTPGAAAQRLRRQIDALSDCRGPHVFDAEDVRLVLEYLGSERTSPPRGARGVRPAVRTGRG